jgi:hypothetical protein
MCDDEKISYLCDSGTEFEGLKIWGSPWTLTFDGINPNCTAFTGDEALLAEKFALIPDDIDILVTHGPPYGVLDKTDRGECVGSHSLLRRLGGFLSPRLHVFGHIHESYGQTVLEYFIKRDKESPVEAKCIDSINCSHVNERYQPVNKPIRIIL